MPPMTPEHKARLHAARDAAANAKRIATSSRAAGRPVPASAASSEPPQVAAYVEIPASSPLEYARDVQEQSLPMEDGLSADASLSSEMPLNLTEEQQLRYEIERIRKVRKPLGTYTQKLALDKRYGYHRHWFNDQIGRVQQAEENGWSHVKDNDGKPMKRPVGQGRDNGVMYAYAMEIPEVFWQEDMDRRHQVAQDRLDATKSQPFKAKQGTMQRSDSGKFYSPVEEAPVLDITSGRGSAGL